MVMIPEKQNTTISVIDEIKVVSENREYLSMSNIGNSCIRSMWMTFRWCSKRIIEARPARIFERGDLEEARIIRDLKKVGVEVYRIDVVDGEEVKVELTGAVGEKQEELVGFAGHAKGHPDGRLLGLIEAPKTEHLLEIKSCNDKYFKLFLKDGLRKTWSHYYDQMIRYMGKMKLTRGFFIATNKNDEQRHSERVYFDKEHYERLLEKEQAVILSEHIPDAPFKPTWFECRYCDHRFTCHKDFYAKFNQEVLPEKNCRTCKFVDLGDDGKWFCGHPSADNDKALTIEEQKAGCGNYELGIYPERSE